MILLIGENNKLEEYIDASKLSNLGIWERTHMEEWIAERPDILGEKLQTITTEYNGFEKTNKRLDILALSKEGKLVVIELKRDIAETFIDLQAIHYAAFCSTHTLKDIIEIRAEYANKSEEEVEEEILQFVENDDFKELDNKPRIILVANEFKEETLAAVLWLRESNVDITCVKLEAYEVGEKIVITNEIIIPLPEAKNFTINREQKSNITSNLRNSEEDRLRTAPSEIKELYDQIKRRVLSLGNEIEVKHKKWYLAFASNSNFIYVFIFKNYLKIVLNLKLDELGDPKKIAEDVSETGHRGNGDYRIKVEPGDDLDYLMTLIKQAYEKYS